MHYRSSLSIVRGLGSAKSGTHHWWLQRVSAVALVILSYWFVVWLGLSMHAPYQEVILWLKKPLHAAAMIAWICAAFYHTALGLQVVIEDYVSHEGRKIITVWTVKLLCTFLALSALLPIFRIILTG